MKGGGPAACCYIMKIKIIAEVTKKKKKRARGI
jgi:hypothetical protein